ncbi:MAG TPA: sugar transferase [Candidatus Fermentibacter daniensis]|nr:sugar transferase [Candidatus Fermentibacter daniensis]HPN63205.1 sugar transferase [Candidatus Fermentibacter daniensis]
MFAPARKADRIMMLLFLAADTVSVPVVFFLTFWLRSSVIGDAVPGFDVRLGDYLHTIPVVWVLWVACFGWMGLYGPKRHFGGMVEAQAMIKALFALGVSMMAASYLAKRDYSRLMLIIYVVMALPISSLARLVARRIARVAAPVAEAPRVLVVGTGEVAVRVRDSLERMPAPHPIVVGFISPDPSGTRHSETIEGLPVAGFLADLPRLLTSMKVDEVFFAAPSLARGRILEVISATEKSDVHFRLVSDLFEISTTSVDLDNLARLPIIEIGHSRGGFFSRAVKRASDIAIASSMLLLLSPFMAIIYLVLLAGGNGSPIFRQVRIGRNGVPFTFYKFRTMKPESGEYEVAPLSPADPRVTGIGRFLRRTSLDELPQLVNVLAGSMSMVGPRPEMPFIVEGYSEWQKRRLDVRPGITGLWQIMGRKDLPLHDNIEYDFYYIRNQSLMLDFAILLRTFASVFRGRGAY